MTFRVTLDPVVDKFLQKLDVQLRERIYEKFRSLRDDPFRFLEHYEGEYYKLRIGPYRALVDVDRSRRIVFIRHFDHRSRIYSR